MNITEAVQDCCGNWLVNQYEEMSGEYELSNGCSPTWYDSRYEIVDAIDSRLRGLPEYDSWAKLSWSEQYAIIEGVLAAQITA